MTESTTLREGGGRERGLERDLVVRAALKLLDEVGFTGLTLRKLAERLHVKAAALYWHFENKQDLIDAMAEHIMQREVKSTHPPSSAWADLLAMVGRTNYKALLRYRDGAQVMAHANLRQSTMLEGMEQMLRSLEAQGFSSELAVASFFAIIRYTLGCVFEEQADPRSRDERIAERTKHWRSMAAKYPTITKTFGEVMPRQAKEPDHMFELGLGIILDGIAKQLADQSPKTTSIIGS
jgi:TetR/AcrR family tetracycline transcriptional repressor